MYLYLYIYAHTHTCPACVHSILLANRSRSLALSPFATFVYAESPSHFFFFAEYLRLFVLQEVRAFGNPNLVCEPCFFFKWIILVRIILVSFLFCVAGGASLFTCELSFFFYTLVSGIFKSLVFFSMGC
jgi:hypothetical protein